MKKLNTAAALLGRRGGQVTGPCKARTQQIKAYWASAAGLARRAAWAKAREAKRRAAR